MDGKLLLSVTNMSKSENVYPNNPKTQQYFQSWTGAKYFVLLSWLTFHLNEMYPFSGLF